MESNIAKLLEEICSLRQEIKEEIDTLKSNINSVKKSVDKIWATIEDERGNQSINHQNKAKLFYGVRSCVAVLCGFPCRSVDAV